MKMKLQLNWK